MNKPRFEFVAPGQGWDSILDEFEGTPKDDIYFNYRYQDLYLGRDRRSLGFCFKQGENTFFLPFIARSVSSPATDDECWDLESVYGYGGPICTTMDPAFIQNAWSEFNNQLRRAGCLAAFLRFHPLLNNHVSTKDSVITTWADRQTVLLDLSQSEDEVWAGYQSRTRNIINKALRLGVSVEQHTDIKSLMIFARIYRERMEEIKAESFFIFDDAYFRGVSALGSDRWRVYLAKAEGRIFGGVLLLLSDHHAHYHLSATPKRFQKYCANSILLHEAIFDMLGGRRSWFHFGGGLSGTQDDGLFRFKCGFSPLRATFYLGRMIPRPGLYKAVMDHWARSNPEAALRYGDRVLAYRL